MQIGKATDKVQKYAKRWIQRHRAVKLLQAHARGANARKGQRVRLEEVYAAAARSRALAARAQKNAAIRVQALQRGKMARKQAGGARAAREEVYAAAARSQALAARAQENAAIRVQALQRGKICLLYTSPSPRDS